MVMMMVYRVANCNGSKGVVSRYSAGVRYIYWCMKGLIVKWT